MGKDSELFKAAKVGNNALIERVFASYLKKTNPQAGGGAGGGTSSGSFGSIRHKTHPNIQDESGYTLLHHATLQGHKDTVSLLLKCGASTTITDTSGSCSLHLAAWKGDLEIVRVLVSQGPSRANVNQLNDQEDSALHLASQYGYSDIVEFLLQRHADPLLRNIKGETPLDLAAQYGHLDTVHLLISTAPEILQLQRADFSPLHLAARNGHTVVALSLINAGICVNTVCERGSALHEAAMCGKSDMVKLLLDKGVDLTLKDSDGKDVLDLLRDYTAPRAKEIKKMIEDHMTARTQQAGSSPSSPEGNKVSRVIAVAKANVNAVLEEGSALAFKKGDNIVVQGRSGPDVFVGTAHGRKGSFLVQDATFYKEKGGVLVETDHTHLFSNDVITPVGSLTTPQLPEGAIKITITDKAPYEYVPGFPSPSPPTSTASVAMTMDQPRPLSTVAPGRNEVSSSTQVDAPLSRTWSEPNPKISVNKLPGNDTRLSCINERAEKRRLSKKEKKFQLSKDDGSYSELKPIDPHDAKKQFGDTLKLNPVGPAFQSGTGQEVADNEMVSEENSGHVTTAHNVIGPEGDESKSEFQGSYYVLEVGNFDPIDESPVVSQPASHDSVATPTDVQAGYYLLDLENFDDEASSKVNTTSESKRTGYENVEPSPATPTRSSKVSTSEAPLSPDKQAVAKATSPPPSEVQRATVYENVIISAHGVPEPIVSAEHPYNVPVPTANLPSSTRELPCPPRADGRGVVSGPIEDESGYTVVDESSRKKLAAEGIVVTSRIPDCYEDCKVKDGHSDSQPSLGESPQSSANPSGLICDTSPSPGHKSRSTRKREDVYEAVKMGGSNSSRSLPSSNPQVLINGNSEGNLAQSSLMEAAGIIDNSNDNPFAGLVLSASRQLEESLPQPVTAPPTGERERGVGSEGGGWFRGRVDTVWDDVRMEKEWTKIDTLLRDMSLPEDAQTMPPSVAVGNGLPSHQVADVYQWLRGHQLSGYASVLESSGFDDLHFFNGGILAMDDLEDVGITDEGDRYNLMAAVTLLPEPPKVGHTHSISEWLKLLNLSQLERKFQGYTLKRVSNFWDIELTSVVGVELLGYRKRLQYGIGELRKAHPDWAEKNLLSQQTSNPNSSAVPKLPVKKRKGRGTPTNSTSYQSVGTSSGATGSNSRIRRLSSELWRHPDSALTDGCDYHIKYLGSLLVKGLHGQQSAEEACQKLRQTGERLKKIPDIKLSISWKGVHFADATTKAVVSTHAVRDISCCSADPEDKKVFAYITRDRQANVNYSHVFMAPSQEIAEEIRMTIGQAFEICYQKVMRAKRLSQERRTSGGSPMASPVH